MQKWHTAVRNPQIGDVVIVQDSNLLKSIWKLGKIVQIQPSKDKIVRDVVVRYRGMNAQGNDCDIDVKRSIHRIIVILPKEEQ